MSPVAIWGEVVEGEGTTGAKAPRWLVWPEWSERGESSRSWGQIGKRVTLGLVSLPTLHSMLCSAVRPHDDLMETETGQNTAREVASRTAWGLTLTPFKRDLLGKQSPSAASWVGTPGPQRQGTHQEASLAERDFCAYCVQGAVLKAVLQLGARRRVGG